MIETKSIHQSLIKIHSSLLIFYMLGKQTEQRLLYLFSLWGKISRLYASSVQCFNCLENHYF